MTEMRIHVQKIRHLITVRIGKISTRNICTSKKDVLYLLAVSRILTGRCYDIIDTMPLEGHYLSYSVDTESPAAHNPWQS